MTREQKITAITEAFHNLDGRTWREDQRVNLATELLEVINPPLVWLKLPPIVEGYYFWRQVRPIEPIMRRVWGDGRISSKHLVSEVRTGIVGVEIQGIRLETVDKIGGEWAGPLPTVEEPKS